MIPGDTSRKNPPIKSEKLSRFRSVAAPFHRRDGAGDSLDRAASEVSDLKTALNEHAMVAVTNPLGRIIFVNEKFCAISKLSLGELLGRNIRSLCFGHAPNFFSHLCDTIAQNGVWHGEIQHRAADGALHWIAATVVSHFDAAGKTQQYLAIGSDISQQKHVEAELAQKVRLQQLLVDVSSCFLSVASEDVNAAIQETQNRIGEALDLDRCMLWQTNEQKGEMVLTHCWSRGRKICGASEMPEVLHSLSARTLPRTYARIARGEMFFISSVDDFTSDANEVDALGSGGLKSSVTIPLVANNEVYGALAFASLRAERSWREDEILELKLVAQIIANVVGRQRAEMREEQLRGELTHAMRVSTLGEIVAALAHELNQPLAAILSNAQAARRFLDTGEMTANELRAILDDMVRDDKRAGHVIHNLRAMLSKRPGSLEPCSMNELALEVIDLMRSEMIGANVTVQCALSPDLPAVRASRVELQQVLVNLLMNGVHAMEDTPPAERIIELETREEAQSVVVTVRDRGHGIDPERLDAIFQPFVSSKQDGLGMGLSICRRIIEKHSGTIEAANHGSGGATFCFALPRANDADQ